MVVTDRTEPLQAAPAGLSPVVRATFCVLVLITGTLSLPNRTIPYLQTVPMAIALLASVWFLSRGRSRARADGYADRIGLTAVIALLLVGAADMAEALFDRAMPDQPMWLRCTVLVAYGLVVAAALTWERWQNALLVTQVGAFFALTRSGYPFDDVYVTVHGSIHALLRGHNPYALTFPNPYDAVHTAMYYGPGMVVDGRIDYGFAYLPLMLFGELPGYLLGDLRYSSILAIAATAWIARHLARDRLGRLTALCIVMASLPAFVVYHSWVEPVIGFVLALLVWSLRAGRRRSSAVTFGLLLATKQYLVVALPLLSVLRRLHGRRAVLLALLVTAAVVVPFFLVGPSAFLHSTVELQTRQRFRPDSTSLLVDLAKSFGQPPTWVMGVLPLLAGFLVSWWVARVQSPGATAVAAGVGLSLLAVILSSKQAYVNYYLLVLVAMALATAVNNASADGDTEPSLDDSPGVTPRRDRPDHQLT